jgi:Fur family transcriptional regulator, ferric uptake regulator
VVKQGRVGDVPLAGFQTIDDVLTGMRERGGRVTPARRLLLAALFRSHAHRSAEDLADEVQAQAPDVNISTIYRNLDELVGLGVVDRTYIGGGPATYHLSSPAHGHLVCVQCGTMTEVPNELFGDLAQVVEERYGFAIDPHRFAVTGRCAACR